MINEAGAVSRKAEETLDPDDWDRMEATAQKALAYSLAHIRNVRSRPLWRQMPPEVRARFTGGVPHAPTSLDNVLEELKDDLLPYSMGNLHPRFWMWFMGSGSFTGALADFMAAIDGSNLGGGDTAAALVDRQVVGWLKQMVGFPEAASGTIVSGGSMANMIGLTIARNQMAGVDVRSEGVAAIPSQLRFYASDQVHSCHQKALEALGLGNKALVRVATGPDGNIDLSALEKAIAGDRASGKKPACVIATAGTVNTGAIDDLNAIGALCKREGLWFHVDGCIGALIAIAPENRGLVAGLETADSLALDPHKWLHVPFTAGCALVRDAQAHRKAFTLSPEYLEEKPRGIAGAPFLHDLNMGTSAGFAALKIWMALKENGVEKFGRLIDQNISQAKELSARIENEPRLRLMAPTVINIVNFRYDPGGMDEASLKALNTEIMLRLQEEGIAALSDTTVRGRHSLRVAICNHRTRSDDLELLVREILHVAEAIEAAA